MPRYEKEKVIDKTTVYFPESVKKAIKIYVVNEDIQSMNHFIITACIEKLERAGVKLK